MGGFLLDLLNLVVRCNVGDTNFSVYLKASEESNPTAWSFYKNRRFLELTEALNEFPLSLKQCFPRRRKNKAGNCPLTDYLGQSEGLTWLHKQVCIHDFSIPKRETCYQRFFTNPDETTIDEYSV